MIKDKIALIEGETVSYIQTGVGSIIYLGTEEVFFTLYCAWRLRDREKVVVNWHQESDNEDTLGTEMLSLMGRKISRVDVNELFDLQISFDDDYILDAFVDITDNEYGRSIGVNWDFVLVEQNVCYSVDYKLFVREEAYS
jgi:hypothetical protein